jgi:hypothetical protein
MVRYWLFCTDLVRQKTLTICKQLWHNSFFALLPGTLPAKWHPAALSGTRFDFFANF